LESKILQIIESLDSISKFDQEAVLTFGTFDGVHIGHRAIIKEIVHQAQELGLVGARGSCRGSTRLLPSVVLSFDPHPMYFLSPEECPPILTTKAKKTELLKEMGVDIVIFAKLEEQISEMSDIDFVEQILVQKLRVKSVVVGYDCTFGRNRTGDSNLLEKLGRKYNFAVKVITPQKFCGVVVSSTRIRNAIAQNDLKLAKQLLGRRYSIYGEVIRGKGIGKEIGFPTANINSGDQMLPSPGVYAIRAKLKNEMFGGVLNMGVRPTFGDNQFQIEAHLLGFDAPAYGHTMEIFFIERIRDEIAFSSVTELINQIKRDIEKAIKILSVETNYSSNDFSR
jgi:riboflavin kinase/FMN adenylyltransferase